MICSQEHGRCAKDMAQCPQDMECVTGTHKIYQNMEYSPGHGLFLGTRQDLVFWEHHYVLGTSSCSGNTPVLPEHLHTFLAHTSTQCLGTQLGSGTHYVHVPRNLMPDVPWNLFSWPRYVMGTDPGVLGTWTCSRDIIML